MSVRPWDPSVASVLSTASPSLNVLMPPPASLRASGILPSPAVIAMPSSHNNMSSLPAFLTPALHTPATHNYSKLSSGPRSSPLADPTLTIGLTPFPVLPSCFAPALSCTIFRTHLSTFMDPANSRSLAKTCLPCTMFKPSRASRWGISASCHAFLLSGCLPTPLSIPSHAGSLTPFPYSFHSLLARARARLARG